MSLTNLTKFEAKDTVEGDSRWNVPLNLLLGLQLCVLLRYSWSVGILPWKRARVEQVLLSHDISSCPNGSAAFLPGISHNPSVSGKRGQQA